MMERWSCRAISRLVRRPGRRPLLGAGLVGFSGGRCARRLAATWRGHGVGPDVMITKQHGVMAVCIKIWQDRWTSLATLARGVDSFACHAARLGH